MTHIIKQKYKYHYPLELTTITDIYLFAKSMNEATDTPLVVCEDVILNARSILGLHYLQTLNWNKVELYLTEPAKLSMYQFIRS